MSDSAKKRRDAAYYQRVEQIKRKTWALAEEKKMAKQLGMVK